MEEKKKRKGRVTAIIVTIILAVALVVADLLLFTTSLNETGVGRGFSRYWRE